MTSTPTNDKYHSYSLNGKPFLVFPKSREGEMVEASETFANPNYCAFVNDAYFEALDKKEHFNIVCGGSASGKSEFEGFKQLLECLTSKYFRGMFARKFANTVSDTTFQLLKDIILRHGWHEHFKINEQKMIIKCVYNSNYLKGMGLDDVHKLTSLPAYTDVWIEEPLSKTRNSGEDVSEAQFMELIRRLRGTKDYKVHFHLTFNPISILSWIYNLFFNEDKESQGYSSRSEDFRGRLYVVKTTYKDNFFIDQPEYEASLKLNDPYDFAIFALGEWGLPKADNPAFWNFNYTKHIGNCSEIDYSLPIYLTFDQNIGIMATLVIQWSKERKKIWIRQEFTKSQDNVVLKDKIMQSEFYQKKREAIYLTGDASGKNRHHMSSETFYQYLQRELKIDKQKSVQLNANLEHFDSLNNINRAFTEYEVVIDKSCTCLISDMQATNKTSESKIDKRNHDPHFGDSKRYFIDSVVYRKAKSHYWNVS